MLLTKSTLFFVQALLLVPAVASSAAGTCSEFNMGDSVDGSGYQRCPLPPEETDLRKITGTHVPFPSSTTSQDLLIKESPQRFFGSGHGDAAGAMLLTKSTLFFVQALLLVPAVASSAAGTCSEFNMGDSGDGSGYQRCLLPPEETDLRKITGTHVPFPSSTTSQDLLIKESPQRFFGSGHGDAAGAMLLTKSTLFFVQALLLVPAVASSAAGTCSEFNMGDSVDGSGYQRCPLPPEETDLRKITGTHVPFPSSTTSEDLLIKESPQRFFGSGHGDAAGAMLLTKSTLFFCPGLFKFI
ncbi:hypothetical protein MTO96_031759 [Rhipicephalus appendiculatus]